MRGEIKDCIVYGEYHNRVLLTFPINGFFSRRPLAFGSVMPCFECPASLCWSGMASDRVVFQ